MKTEDEVCVSFTGNIMSYCERHSLLARAESITL